MESNIFLTSIFREFLIQHALYIFHYFMYQENAYFLDSDISYLHGKSTNIKINLDSEEKFKDCPFKKLKLSQNYEITPDEVDCFSKTFL